ncbi:hypothetical protein LVY75_23485 [Sinorhizobium sp. B11]
MFSFDGNVDRANPVAIRVELSNNSAIRIRGSSDGESITVDDQPLEGPADMAELGKIEVQQLTDHFDDAILGCEIVTVNEVLDGNNIAVGLAFNSSETIVLCIWNYGDELHYGNFATMAQQDWGATLHVSSKCYELR